MRRERSKEYEADLKHFNCEAKDIDGGDKVTRVRDGEEEDQEEEWSVCMSLTMDVGPVGASESESPPSLSPGTPAFLVPSRATLKRRAFVCATVQPPAYSPAAFGKYVSGSRRVHFGPRTYRITGVVDHR